jgi:hypothetical protein
MNSIVAEDIIGNNKYVRSYHCKPSQCKNLLNDVEVILYFIFINYNKDVYTRREV